MQRFVCALSNPSHQVSLAATIQLWRLQALESLLLEACIAYAPQPTSALELFQRAPVVIPSGFSRCASVCFRFSQPPDSVLEFTVLMKFLEAAFVVARSLNCAAHRGRARHRFVLLLLHLLRVWPSSDANCEYASCFRLASFARRTCYSVSHLGAAPCL